MAFQIVRNDIVNMRVDAIVNTANPRPQVGSGTDTGIHAKAGPMLLEARKKIGAIRPGSAAVTPAFDLDAKYVIHAVGPVWRGGLFGEAKTLRSCYDTALRLAADHGCKSVAFPLISAGSYGFPKEKAMQIAIQAFSEFLTEHDMEIYLVVFNQDVFRLSEKLFRDVSSYIDQHYVEKVQQFEYTQFPQGDQARRRENFGWREITGALPVLEDYAVEESECASRKPVSSGKKPLPPAPPACAAKPAAQAPMPRPSEPKAQPRKKMSMSLEDWVLRTDAGFSETLLKLIDQSGKKDSEIYNKANVSRQHFSKIRNNRDYKPTKPTAIAFAIALELDMAQTEDLIKRAGFALTKSSLFDVIIMYFIETGNYNLYDINAALYEFDQSLLGA